jgi:D-3-phosphoglycerate dehydrogenase
LSKILCITPVKHLEGVYEKLLGYGEVIYEPEIDRDTLKIMLDVFGPEYLFTNPNKQNFLLDGDILQCGKLKVINTCSTGLNHIDLDYCKEHNIDIWSLKEDYELINDLPSTSELAFGLMLSLLRNIPKSFHSVRDGNWDYEPFVGHQIKGKTIGVIGYGRLGKIMCRLFDSWGVKILLYDPYVFSFGGVSRVNKRNRQIVELDELLERSDVISLHVHVTDETRGMIDDEFLSKMKQGSYLVNTSRGELVDEDSIIKSIEQGHLKGYGTDVIKDEFGDIQNSKLVEFSINPNNNVVITPHIGGMTIEGQTKAYTWAVSKFKDIK